MDGKDIIALTDAALTILAKLPRLREIAKQNAELTPEQEAELDGKIKTAFEQAHWQPSDAPAPASPS